MQFLQQDRISSPEPSTIHRRVLQHTVFSHNLGSHPNEDIYFPTTTEFQVGLILYLVAFQSGVGPVPWVYNPEVGQDDHLRTNQKHLLRSILSGSGALE